MRQIPNHQLWIGNAGDLRDARAILAAGVEAVIEVADNELLAQLPRELVRLRFPLSEGGSNPAWLLRLAANSLAELMRANIPTLVCCSVGLSRSVCVAAAGLSISTGQSLEDSLSYVASSGPCRCLAYAVVRVPAGSSHLNLDPLYDLSGEFVTRQEEQFRNSGGKRLVLPLKGDAAAQGKVLTIRGLASIGAAQK